MLNTAAFAIANDLTHYLRRIDRYPLLDAETERELARRCRDDDDDAAAQLLANSYLRLVVKIAKGFLGYKLPLADLVSEGNVGLMQAIRRFDPEQGFRLSTYAPWWIRAAIQEYVLRSQSLVRMGTTAAQKKLFFNLRRLKAAHEVLGDGDLAPETVAAIAHELAVEENEVVEMNRRLVGGTHSLNAPTREGADTDFQDLLVDQSADHESVIADAEEMEQRRHLMTEALAILNDRERHILTERRLKDDPPTLETLSGQYGVSRERVRQIEVQAFNKLCKAVNRAAKELGAGLAA
jgi:RNA polymerase sigma-32 factor